MYGKKKWAIEFRAEKFGANLRRLRRDRPDGVWIRQKQLARLLGTTERGIRKWENGERLPTVTTLLRLAALFDVTLDEMFL